MMKRLAATAALLMSLPALVNASSPRIVGGADAAIESYPWQVALLSDDPNLYDAQSCGGSLVDERWVLTAAHCVAEEDAFTGKPSLTGAVTRVAVGITDLNDSSRAQVISVEKIVFHPDYVPATFDNDLALIRLASPVDMKQCGDRCKIIPVISPANEGALVTTGTAALISGWGNRSKEDIPDFPSQLQAAQISIMACTGSGSGYAPEEITANMVCAGVPSSFVRDTCQGDSGGPLVVEKGSSGYIQVGVVSFGEGCAMPNFPGVYTRLSRYDTWLRSTSGGEVIASTSSGSAGGGSTGSVSAGGGSSSGGGITVDADDDDGGGGGSIGFLLLGLVGLGWARRHQGS